MLNPSLSVPNNITFIFKLCNSVTMHGTALPQYHIFIIIKFY